MAPKSNVESDPMLLDNVVKILNDFTPFMGIDQSQVLGQPDEMGQGMRQGANPIRGCTCKKSLCLKLYCQCFAAKMYCSGPGGMCKCLSCFNQNPQLFSSNDFGFDAAPLTVSAITPPNLSSLPSTVQKRVASLKSILERNPSAFAPKTGPLGSTRVGCKCRKSACLKKYCECFLRGEKCTSSCRCVGCMNKGLPGGPGVGGDSLQPEGWEEDAADCLAWLKVAKKATAAQGVEIAAAVNGFMVPEEWNTGEKFGTDVGRVIKGGKPVSPASRNNEGVMMAALAMFEMGAGAGTSTSTTTTAAVVAVGGGAGVKVENQGSEGTLTGDTTPESGPGLGDGRIEEFKLQADSINEGAHRENNGHDVVGVPELRKVTSTGGVTESIGKLGVTTTYVAPSGRSSGDNSGMKSPKRKTISGTPLMGSPGVRKTAAHHHTGDTGSSGCGSEGENSDTTTHESDEEKESKERAEGSSSLVGGGMGKQQQTTPNRRGKGRHSKRTKGGGGKGAFGSLVVDTNKEEGDTTTTTTTTQAKDGITPVSGFLEGGFKRIEIKR